MPESRPEEVLSVEGKKWILTGQNFREITVVGKFWNFLTFPKCDSIRLHIVDAAPATREENHQKKKESPLSEETEANYRAKSLKREEVARQRQDLLSPGAAAELH